MFTYIRELCEDIHTAYRSVVPTTSTVQVEGEHSALLGLILTAITAGVAILGAYFYAAAAIPSTLTTIAMYFTSVTAGFIFHIFYVDDAVQKLECVKKSRVKYYMASFLMGEVYVVVLAMMGVLLV